jgi:hypothetical protein
MVCCDWCIIKVVLVVNPGETNDIQSQQVIQAVVKIVVSLTLLINVLHLREIDGSLCLPSLLREHYSIFIFFHQNFI